MSESGSFPGTCCASSLRLASLLLLASFLPAICLAEADSWSVTSPNGLIKLSVRFASPAGGGGKRLYYRVEQGAAGNRTPLINDSPLGLRLQDQDVASTLKFNYAEAPISIEENYVMPHGKRRQCHNRANGLSLFFQNANTLNLAIDLRAYDDGAAFRYRLPGRDVRGQTLEAELTGFALPADAKFWCAPSDKASIYTPAYETYYASEMSVDTPSPTGAGWSFPLLFRTADRRHWGLITEANVDGHFCGSRLSSTALKGAFLVTLPSPAEGNGLGSPKPSSELPWEMPWRVIVAGDSLATVVESTLVTDVSTPSKVQDSSWVRPGRVAWSWWSDNASPKDADKQRKFIDLAAEMGWEYLLVDANWTIMENGNIHDVLRYAKEKGVGVLLWYNSGGAHSLVPEKPRDCLTLGPVREFELKLLSDWGVRGIKVDFFMSDKQDMIELYHGIMRDAAAHKIMVNFHGCTLPRGWERTYPHLMSMEAVRGEECYIFDRQYPEQAPVQNAILPFTRNAVGPMDYTCVGFSDNRYPHKTSYAHELALSVLFESGWLHFIDKPEAYLNLPPAPKQFLKNVPVAWDDTRFVAGYPGQFAILARQKNDIWYLAGVNAESRSREENIKPRDWLRAGRYELTTIGDGENPKSFQAATSTFNAGEAFTMKMLPYGGFVAVLKPAP